ncbi:MAG: DUF5693 family protein [Deinococcaceae bacterium]
MKGLRDMRIRVGLFLLLILSLIPAVWLLVGRISHEADNNTLALVLDYSALDEQASRTGTPLPELLGLYREQGVNTLALYEDTVQSKIKRGDIFYQDGATLLAQHPTTDIKPGWHYYTEVKSGSLSGLGSRYTFPYESISVAGKRWMGWPVPISGMPAGPNLALIRELQSQGYAIVYRPGNNLALKNPGMDIPKVEYVAFSGEQVLGYEKPETFKQVSQRLGNIPLAFIEAVDQKGLSELLETHPGIRLFSINPQWQASLKPEEVAGKFVLAARERMHRLLYLRPYETQEDTLTLLKGIKEGISRAGLHIGFPKAVSFEPNSWLRKLTLLAPVAGLGLLLSAIPLGGLALLVGAATLGLVALASGFQLFSSAALLVGIVFPALGLMLRRNTPWDWLMASLITLLGTVYLSALGTDAPGMLGLKPFQGVSLVLFWPTVLFAAVLVPKQDIRKTIRDLYHRPVQLGDLALIAVVLGAMALIFLRRGNDTGASASGLETAVRSELQESLIRPRFKELMGHPLALLGLSKVGSPYVGQLLLLAGVFGQSSLMNTFGHYHTPFLISFYRAFNGLWMGGLVGFILIPLALWVVRWFNAVPEPESNPRI